MSRRKHRQFDPEKFNLDKMHENMEHRFGNLRAKATGTYWWIWGKLDSGRHIVLGPYYDEASANETAYAKFDETYEVVALRTIDKSSATSQLKARFLQKGATAEEAIQRVRHRGKGTGIE